MAKQVLNIVDFSGGINKAVDKRDIELKQIVDSDGLMSYRAGRLTLKGCLNTIPGLNENTGSFSSQYISEGIPNLYGIFPEFGFRIFGKAKCTGVSGTTGTYTVEPANAYHSLDLGAKLTIILSNSDSQFVSKNLIVTEIVNNTSFKADDSTGMSTNGLIYYALNAQYDSNEILVSKGTTNYDDNKYFFKATQYGKFGFYNIGSFRHWYGRSDEGYFNHFSNDPWYFDTKYLWDWKQDNTGLLNQGNINQTKVLDGFYESGVFRLLLDFPNKYNYGRFVRPIGLYAINDSTRFGTSKVFQGWYPLRSHCLSPEEYHNATTNITSTNQGTNFNGAGSIIHHNTAATLTDWDAQVESPVGVGYLSSTKIPHQFAVGVGTGNNSISGDWQFDTDQEHRKIGLGISFLYDNIENPSESLISPLITSANANTVTISGENDKALFLYWKVYQGDDTHTSNQKELSNTFQYPTSVAEFRGSDMNEGFSNWGQWNPRIVGANVWLTYNNEGAIDDPLWLATISFENTKKSFSHDGIEVESTSEDWDASNEGAGYTVRHQFIKGIPTVPVLTYSLKNGYKHTDNIHAWYKTHAIVNRRLYAGNVAYYKDKEINLSQDASPDVFPDRILRSPVNKFDILPSSSFLDITNNDGQDIIKLVSFNQKLLVFKNDDLFVIDCSGEIEYLESTHRGVGISSPTAVCPTPNAIYWVNSQGVYAMDMENPPVNIIKNMIPTDEWVQKIYNPFTHIEYEPQDNLLLIFTRYKDVGHSLYDQHVWVVNIATAGLYFKSSPSVIGGSQYSKGVIANNKLYLSVKDASGDGESFHANNSTAFVRGNKARVVLSFKINNSSHNNSLGGTGNKYLMLHKGSTWTKINNTAFNESLNLSDDEEAANLLIPSFLEKSNTLGVNNSDYIHTMTYLSSNDSFLVTAWARYAGASYTLNAESKGDYGSTPWALSNDGTEGNIAIGDLTNFTIMQNHAGTDNTYGVWQIYADRGGKSNSGTEYTIEIQYGISTGNDSFESRTMKTHYITSTNPANLYNAATSSNYANDSDSSASNLDNSNALITNIHEFLQNNTWIDPHSGLIDLNDHFDFGAITTDSDGSVTGTNNLKYFTMTMKSSSPFSSYSDTAINAYATGGTNGSILRWESDAESDLNKALLETKDFDFEQPNVRKKIYKAYITYKADSDIKVYYQANQSGSFTLATVENSTTDNTLLHSTEYTRGEITFGTGGNNIYSFALKFESTNVAKIFDINDISFVYRIKRPK